MANAGGPRDEPSRRFRSTTSSTLVHYAVDLVCSVARASPGPVVLETAIEDSTPRDFADNLESPTSKVLQSAAVAGRQPPPSTYPDPVDELSKAGPAVIFGSSLAHGFPLRHLPAG